MGSQNDDVYRLILKTEGRQEVRELEEALNHEVETLRLVDAALKINATNQQQYDAQLAKTKVASEALIDGQKRLAVAMKSTSIDAAAASRGVLEFSRGVEDFTTGGPIGLLNNIPGMVQSAGQAFSLTTAQIGFATAGLSLFSTAAYIAYRNSDKIATVFGLGRTQTEAEAMKELGDQTERTAAEQDKLNRYKQREAEIERQRNAKSGMEKERQEAVAEILDQFKDENLVDKLVQARNPLGLKHLYTADEKDQIERRKTEAKRAITEGYGPEVVDRTQRAAAKVEKDAFDRARDAEKKRAETTLADAKNTPEGQRQLIGELRRSPKIFDPDAGKRGNISLADILEGATAEGLTEKGQLDAEREGSDQDWKDKKDRHKGKVKQAEALGAKMAKGLEESILKGMADGENAEALKGRLESYAQALLEKSIPDSLAKGEAKTKLAHEAAEHLVRDATGKAKASINEKQREVEAIRGQGGAEMTDTEAARELTTINDRANAEKRKALAKKEAVDRITGQLQAANNALSFDEAKNIAEDALRKVEAGGGKTEAQAVQEALADHRNKLSDDATKRATDDKVRDTAEAMRATDKNLTPEASLAAAREAVTMAGEGILTLDQTKAAVLAKIQQERTKRAELVQLTDWLMKHYKLDRAKAAEVAKSAQDIHQAVPGMLPQAAIEQALAQAGTKADAGIRANLEREEAEYLKEQVPGMTNAQAKAAAKHALNLHYDQGIPADLARQQALSKQWAEQVDAFDAPQPIPQRAKPKRPRGVKKDAGGMRSVPVDGPGEAPAVPFPAAPGKGPDLTSVLNQARQIGAALNRDRNNIRSLMWTPVR